MAKRNQVEMRTHLAILKWLEVKLRGAVIHHSPNEFGMSGAGIARQVAKHKRMGMLVGFPDLIVWFKGRFVGLEVKSPTGRQSESQKDVQEAIKYNGGEYHVVRSIDDVARIFEGQK